MMIKRGVMVVVISSMIAGGARAQSAAPPPPPAVPQNDYDQKFIGFDDYGAIDPDTGQFAKVTELYKGKDKQQLAPLDFYRLVGRDDLADEYMRRDLRRNLLIGAGAVVAVGGLAAAAAIVSAGRPGDCPQGDFATFSACASSNDQQYHSALVTSAAVGGGGVLVGGLLLLAGVGTDPNPIAVPQMRALADQYNQHLNEESRLRILPLASPSETGVALDLRF